jgi:hypothetical protein
MFRLPSILTALEQMGLKLVPDKGPQGYIVYRPRGTADGELAAAARLPATFVRNCREAPCAESTSLSRGS